MAAHNLVPPIGFIFDTSLAIARCIYDGFLDRYPNLKLMLLIAAERSPFSSAGWTSVTSASRPAERARRIGRATNTIPEMRMLGLMCVSIGAFSAMSVFWTVPPTLLSPGASSRHRAD